MRNFHSSADCAMYTIAADGQFQTEYYLGDLAPYALRETYGPHRDATWGSEQFI